MFVIVKLILHEKLGNRLLASIDRAATSKVVHRPEGSKHRRTVWQDVHRAKGLNGTIIAVCCTRLAESETFTPTSSGGSSSAVIAGSGPTKEHAIFGHINAEELVAEATPLRSIIDVHAQAGVCGACIESLMSDRYMVPCRRPWHNVA